MQWRAVCFEGVYAERTLQQTNTHTNIHTHIHTRIDARAYANANEIDFLHFFLLLANFADGNQLHKLTVAGAPTAIKTLKQLRTAITTTRTTTTTAAIGECKTIKSLTVFMQHERSCSTRPTASNLQLATLYIKLAHKNLNEFSAFAGSSSNTGAHAHAHALVCLRVCVSVCVCVCVQPSWHLSHKCSPT